MDQNSLRTGRTGKVCVQGLVTLHDVSEDTGGLAVIPGSHLSHSDLCSRAANPLMPDFVPVPKDDPVLSTGAGLVLAKAGDLILWDSRTVHCNMPALRFLTQTTPSSPPATASVIPPAPPSGTDPPTSADAGREKEVEGAEGGTSGGHTSSLEASELIRLVGYICMVPRSWATSEILDLRLTLFTESTGTTHCPHEIGPVRRTVKDLMPKDCYISDPKALSQVEWALIGSGDKGAAGSTERRWSWLPSMWATLMGAGQAAVKK